MIKQIIAAAVFASSAFGIAADNNDTMYLIKGNQVVGKYKVADVDYASFTLPEDVDDSNISLNINKVGKNSVSYTINTVNSNIAYAHNVLSEYDLEMSALDMLGEQFASLDEENKISIMQYTLSNNAYVGASTATYTQNDFQLDNTGENSRFSVMPGTHYYLCAWEVNPSDYSPLETFVYKEFDTEEPAQGTATINFALEEVNEHGAQMKVTGSNVYYVRTCWGSAPVMQMYVETYGLDYLMGMFGQNWDLEFLQGTGDLGAGISNSIWPAYESGQYIMYARAYDADGNVTDSSTLFNVEVASETESGPAITIFSKEKRAGYVSVNFEIAPSNVEEAYVRLCSENDVDDRLNMGYELHEIAMGGDAEDITLTINTMGEYTYTNSQVEAEWKALLITALDKDGNRSTLRINFYPDEDSQWAIESPVYKSLAKKKLAVKRIVNKRNPAISR